MPANSAPNSIGVIKLPENATVSRETGDVAVFSDRSVFRIKYSLTTTVPDSENCDISKEYRP